MVSFRSLCNLAGGKPAPRKGRMGSSNCETDNSNITIDDPIRMVLDAAQATRASLATAGEVSTNAKAEMLANATMEKKVENGRDNADGVGVGERRKREDNEAGENAEEEDGNLAGGAKREVCHQSPAPALPAVADKDTEPLHNVKKGEDGPIDFDHNAASIAVSAQQPQLVPQALQQDNHVETKAPDPTHTPSSPPAPLAPPTRPPVATINVSIRDANGYRTNFNCKPSTKLSKLFKAFAMRYQADMGMLRFISFDGTPLPKNNPRATLQSEGIQDGDEIDVMLEQIGGSSPHACKLDPQ